MQLELKLKITAIKYFTPLSKSSFREAIKCALINYEALIILDRVSRQDISIATRKIYFCLHNEVVLISDDVVEGKAHLPFF